MNTDLAAELAIISYSDLPELLFTLDIENEYVQVFLQNNNTVIINWRGTDEIKDWLRNGDFDLVTTPIGQVHSGFWEAYKAVRPELKKRLESVKFCKIVLIGHSGGAACAQIAAADIPLWDGFTNTIDKLYLFASPKVGDWVFCESVEKNCLQIFRYEVVSGWPFLKDPVPLLPPGKNYRQVGERIELVVWGNPLDLHSMTTYSEAASAYAKKMEQ
jgi:predicted lipase